MPSPPQTTSAVDPVGHALVRQVERLVGVAALRLRTTSPAPRRRPQGHVAGAGALALARRGVGQQGDLAHSHAADGRASPAAALTPATLSGRRSRSGSLAEAQQRGVARRLGPDRPGQPRERLEHPVGRRTAVPGTASVSRPSYVTSSTSPCRHAWWACVPQLVVGRPARGRPRRRPAGRTGGCRGRRAGVRRAGDLVAAADAALGDSRRPRPPPASRAGRTGRPRRSAVDAVSAIECVTAARARRRRLVGASAAAAPARGR